jgi:hypothetical protein
MVHGCPTYAINWVCDRRGNSELLNDLQSENVHLNIQVERTYGIWENEHGEQAEAGMYHIADAYG